MFTMRRIVSVTAVALFFLMSGFAGAAEAVSPAPLGSLVDVGGYRGHLYCTGAGSPGVVVVVGAFSFDWGLIQPEVAKFTRICTYDASGTAWSDAYRSGQERKEETVPRCADRVMEIHQLLKNAGVPGPYVLVGFSIGGLMLLLLSRNSRQVLAGNSSHMVIIDEPEVVTSGIWEVVQAIKRGTSLKQQRNGER